MSAIRVTHTKDNFFLLSLSKEYIARSSNILSPSNILIAKRINVAAGEREVTAERTRRADHGAAQGPGAATQGESGEATGSGFWRQSDTQAPGKSRPCTISCVCPPFVIVSSSST